MCLGGCCHLIQPLGRDDGACARAETMATEDAASGGSVVVAEALRQRAARERARWEAFQRERDDARAASDRGRERWAPPRARATSDIPATRDEGHAGPSSSAPDASRDHLTASAPSPRDASDADADDDAPQCRICFSGAEAGRLFAPCHCRGTMRHVHVACLDTWRNASARANNASYHACDQCGFRYRTERGAWATFLEDPKTADRLAWTATAAAVFLAGTLSRAVSTRALVPFVARVARALRRAPVRYGFEETSTFRRVLARLDALAAPRPSHDWRNLVDVAVDPAASTATVRIPTESAKRAARTVARALSAGTRESTSPLHVEFAFYRLVGWTDPGPPWWNPAGAPRWLTRSAALADLLDCLVAGVVIIGALGFMYNAAARLGRDFRANAQPVLFPVFALFASHGVGASRLLLVGGAAYACASAHRAATRLTRAALTRFGERVLDIGAGVPTGVPMRGGGTPRPHLN